MKRVILSALFMTLIFIGGFTTSSFASESNPITDELNRIADEYEVGEVLSDEDAEFVLEHGNLAPESTDIMPIFSYSPTLSGSKTLNGVWVGVQASCNINHWNPFSNKYNCTVKANSNKGTVKAQLEHVAYGLLGKDGKLGKLYGRTFPASSSKDNPTHASLSAGDNYVGGVVVSTTTVRGTAVYGSTTVSAYDSY
ncbi:hypothetical protein ACQKMI_17305 [Lysinibacillus sp. NPDC097214]|uniref:hypothetical protein n=1 Tax=Lysinibacillus sp. NPDC097214 TaxID=3390584 RepID=UPI003D019305